MFKANDLRTKSDILLARIFYGMNHPIVSLRAKRGNLFHQGTWEEEIATPVLPYGMLCSLVCLLLVLVS